MKTFMQTEFRDPIQSRSTIVRVVRLDDPQPKIARGLVLVDRTSFEIVSLDRGAAAILNHNHGADGNEAGSCPINKNILDAVRRVRTKNPARPQREFRVGAWRFSCRSYLLENHDGSGVQPLVAVLIERHAQNPDAIEDVGARYHLTARERQALRGLSCGLSIQALAADMNVKPGTLNASLRLIKNKMGVATRAGMMLKILETKRT